MINWRISDHLLNIFLEVIFTLVGLFSAHPNIGPNIKSYLNDILFRPSLVAGNCCTKSSADLNSSKLFKISLYSALNSASISSGLVVHR